MLFRSPEQIIQPYQFGDTESKRTCLWIEGVQILKHTKIVKPKIYAYYKRGKKKGKPIYGNDYMKFSEDRGKIRSKTFPGIAKAMAEQWGNVPCTNNISENDGVQNKTTSFHGNKSEVGK